MNSADLHPGYLNEEQWSILTTDHTKQDSVAHIYGVAIVCEGPQALCEAHNTSFRTYWALPEQVVACLENCFSVQQQQSMDQMTITYFALAIA